MVRTKGSYNFTKTEIGALVDIVDQYRQRLVYPDQRINWNTITSRYQEYARENGWSPRSVGSLRTKYMSTVMPKTPSPLHPGLLARKQEQIRASAARNAAQTSALSGRFLAADESKPISDDAPMPLVTPKDEPEFQLPAAAANLPLAKMASETQQTSAELAPAQPERRQRLPSACVIAKVQNWLSRLEAGLRPPEDDANMLPPLLASQSSLLANQQTHASQQQLLPSQPLSQQDNHQPHTDRRLSDLVDQDCSLDLGRDASHTHLRGSSVHGLEAMLNPVDEPLCQQQQICLSTQNQNNPTLAKQAALDAVSAVETHLPAPFLPSQDLPTDHPDRPQEHQTVSSLPVQTDILQSSTAGQSNGPKPGSRLASEMAIQETAAGASNAAISNSALPSAANPAIKRRRLTANNQSIFANTTTTPAIATATARTTPTAQTAITTSVAQPKRSKTNTTARLPPTNKNEQHESESSTSSLTLSIPPSSPPLSPSQRNLPVTRGDLDHCRRQLKRELAILRAEVNKHQRFSELMLAKILLIIAAQNMDRLNR